MSQLIQHHALTDQIAIFCSDDIYWIGSYSPHLTHQTSEPPYVWAAGNWNQLELAQAHLALMTGDEF